jgi:hypothetical protein
MARFRREDDYQYNKVVSIHDPWAPGMGLGDIDDWAAIYYLAKRVTYPVIYIVSDVAVQDPAIAPGGAATRFDAFMALHAANLRAINGNIEFVSVATWDAARAHLEQAQKIIICGRVGKERDPTLYAWLTNPANLATKSVYGSPAYNFGNFPLNVSPNPAFNLLPTDIVIPSMIPYASNSINRRVRREQLNSLITIGPNGGPNNAIIDLMMMYGFMKNVCLPSSPTSVGFLVNSPGVGLGNSAYGIALYRGLDVQSGRPPADLIQEYISGMGSAERGDANPWVAARLAIPGIDAFITGTRVDTRPKPIQDMFFEALAVAIELFIDYVNVPAGQTAIGLLANGFPTLSTNNTFRLPPIPISSPMWDLFLVTCSLRGITPTELDTRASLVGAPNSFPSPELLKLSGLDPISIGGKTRRKRTKRKRRSVRR